MPQTNHLQNYPQQKVFSLQVSENSGKYDKSKKRKMRTRRLLSHIAGPELMDLKIDYAFKQLFANEKNKEITRVFLNGFLLKAGRKPIQNLTFKNVEISREYENDKQARLDLLIETEDKELINVEIQFTNEYNMIKRTMYYWARLYEKPLEKAQDYEELNSVITINIMNFELFYDLPAYHTIFQMFERYYKRQLTGLVECHFVEIPKLINAWKKEQLNPWDDLLTRWLLLLGAVDKKRNQFNDDIYQELEEIAMSDKTLHEAMQNWNELSRTEEHSLEYEARLKQILDEQSRQRNMERKMEQVQKAKQMIEDADKKVKDANKKVMDADKKVKDADKKVMDADKKVKNAEKQTSEEREMRLKAEKQADTALEQGKKAATLEIARQLLRQGLDHFTIVKSTGLVESEVKALLLEIEDNHDK
ncbi:hypothetical protein J14TS2_49960 [Bacillus sp. J14TS2]|uniref:Rpn family recombination-promoting nuclease/putative transposase n=1 Tax=Bacillus sp. J14TS2 TaxID=2807188 RepID=UPI001B09AA31|nr:Rpn family recombination-promoting nuclease/putative transposase [Bacillus sp. J14TS2]GIN74521.1 hypothetical protein J14TS2_49960 [Bacillus sp. J14TS2]